MASLSTAAAVVRLSDLVDGQEAVCFAALVKKVRGTTSRNQPFVKCYFRDKRTTLEAPIWFDHPLYAQAEQWADGLPYRLRVRSDLHLRYGLQLDILEIRPATAEDDADGFDFSDLFESSEVPPRELRERLEVLIERYIADEKLRQLVRSILAEHEELFLKMPAAQNFHHSYTGGLIEHVWSMSRIAAFLATHYASYYHELDPPLDTGVIVAAAILHDIGKVLELKYHPVEAKYTKEGKLIGHVLMGRDLVREAARRIPGFPEETQLLLEHAILSHHGKREFGAPVLPQTIEALIVSFIDDLDAKVNMVARGRMQSTTDDEFTERVYALDNRQIYKGARTLPSAEENS